MRRKDPIAALVQGVKARAKRKGIPFDITAADLAIPEACPILGVPIVLEPFRHDHGPSIDRKKPGLGYVRGNVQIISNLANRMKSNATIDDLRKLLTYMETE